MEKIENWLEKFKKNWIEKNVAGVLELFTEDVEYFENPFLKVKNFSELKKEWEYILTQQNINLDYQIFSKEENKYSVIWNLKYENEKGKNKIFSGVYLIRLNQDNLCDYFYHVGEENTVEKEKQKNIFELWNELKQRINKKKHVLPNKKEIWWLKIGQNVGYEQNGKGENFLRPVLVLRVFNTKVFFGVPMSSSNKNEDSPYYLKTLYNQKKYFFLLLQARLFSTKRLHQVIRVLDNEEFDKVKKGLRKLLRI